MARTRLPLSALLTLIPFAACECGDGLNVIEYPQAELSYGADKTPPLDHLEVIIGPTLIGASDEFTIILKNVGGQILDVGSISVGSDPELCPQPTPAFRVTSTTPDTLGVGEEHEIKLEFSPEDGAQGCAVVNVATNDEEEPVLQALLTGRGDAPGLCTTDTLVDFGEVHIGDTGEKTIELVSCGSRPITLNGLLKNDQFPPFGVELPSFPVTLQPDESLTIPASFTPDHVEQYSLANGNAGMLTVDTDDLAQIYQIALVGQALPAPACVITVLPGVLNFGYSTPDEVEESDVIIRNTGELDCTVDAVALREDASPFSFSLDGWAEGDTLTAGQIARVKVKFTGPADPGTYTDVLDVLTSDPLNPSHAVELQGAIPPEGVCVLEAIPPTVNFGTVPPGVFRSRSVEVKNISDETCFLTGSELLSSSDEGFIDGAPGLGIMLAGATKDIGVGFIGQTENGLAAGPANGTLQLEYKEGLTGPTSILNIALSAFSGPPGICVEPERVAFGVTNSPETMDLTITACGTETIVVTGVAFTDTDNEDGDVEFGMTGAPPGSVTLMPGQTLTVTVTYNPNNDQPDQGIITVTSTDEAYPSIDVLVTGGPEIVPASAGRYLYYWQIPNIIGGDVVRLPLQGDIAVEPFWGPRTGQSCAGCHSVSPDGKFVAVVETAQMRFIDTESGTELFLGNTYMDPSFFSWRPQVETDPPYQFVYGNGYDLVKAALFDGEMGTVQGANDPGYVESMPSWGPTGKIAFARGTEVVQQEEGSAFGFAAPPVDVMIVDENGGTPEPLDGASGDGEMHYYPVYAPNGAWIAVTHSVAGGSQGTIAAPDATIRLVKADNSGSVKMLDNINSAGPNSYVTWAVDSSHISFSSLRPGGAGDWDIWLAPIDFTNINNPVDGTPMNLNDYGLGELNTDAFEHAAQWSP